MIIVEIDFKMIKGPEDSKPENFEEMCCQLFQEEYPDANIKRTAPSYVGDAGVDFYGTFDGRVRAFQCKYFPHQYGQSQFNQIKSSLKTAVEKRTQYNWYKWILCLPRTLTHNQKQKINNLAKTYNVNLDYVEETELRRRLSKHEHIVRQFFSISPQSSTNLPLIEPQFEAINIGEVTLTAAEYSGAYFIYRLNITLVNTGTTAAKNFAIQFEIPDWIVYQTRLPKKNIYKNGIKYQQFRIDIFENERILLSGDSYQVFEDAPDTILCKKPIAPDMILSRLHGIDVKSKIYWKIIGAQPREGSGTLRLF